MNALSPSNTARLAEQVYEVFTESDVVDAFLISGLKAVGNLASVSPRIIKGETGGYLVRKRDVFAMSALVNRGGKNELVIVFRGTIFKRAQDLMTNTQTGIRVGHTGKRVHVGFDKVLGSMLTDLTLTAARSKDIFDIHCIGHSLGGAVATLAADWLRSMMPSTRVRLYSFGSPRVGVEDFARNFTRKVYEPYQYRVSHETDPVPMIPIFPFVHTPLPGLGFPLESKEYPLLSAHKMTNYISSVKDKDWTQLNRQTPVFDRPKMIQHWLKSTKPFVLADSLGMGIVNYAIAWALSQAIDKGIVKLNIRLFVGSTVVDTLARAFHEGLSAKDIKSETSMWLELAIRKIARSIGIKIRDTLAELTFALIRRVFEALVQRMNDLVRKSLSHLMTAM